MSRLALGTASGQYNFPLRHTLISNIVIPCVAQFQRTECKLVYPFVFMGYMNTVIKEKEKSDIFYNDYTTFNDLFQLIVLIVKSCPSEVETNKDFSAAIARILQYGSVLQIQSLFCKCCFLTNQSSQKTINETISAILHAYSYYTDSMENALFYTMFLHCRTWDWI